MPGPVKRLRGRSATENPANRFETLHCETDLEHLETADEQPASGGPATEFLVDRTQSVITKNDSPDIPFRYGINPYRGCEHGCAYCYARPYHEYLSMGRAWISNQRFSSSATRRSCCARSWPSRVGIRT